MAMPARAAPPAAPPAPAAVLGSECNPVVGCDDDVVVAPSTPDAVVAPQSRPVRLGPLSWWMKMGRLVTRGWPVTESGTVVSPLAMTTQPLPSVLMVK